MKTTRHLDLEMDAVSLRSAWLIRRACRPGRLSPISPSISARGVSAATESITIMSTAPERTRVSVISSACSPVSGCDTRKVVEVHAKLLRIAGVEGVFRVHEGRDAARLLHFRYGVQSERGLAGRFRTENFNDAATRQTADAQRHI